MNKSKTLILLFCLIMPAFTAQARQNLLPDHTNNSALPDISISEESFVAKPDKILTRPGPPVRLVPRPPVPLKRENIITETTNKQQTWQPPCDCIPIMAQPSYVKNKPTKGMNFGGIYLPPGVTPESIATLSARKDFDDLSQTTVDNKMGFSTNRR